MIFLATWVVLSLALSLSPLPGLGYVVFLIGAATKLRILHSFDTYFANLIFALLILMSSIMVSGIFTSYLNIPNLEAINTTFALFFCYLILHLQPKNLSKNEGRLFNWSDFIGIAAGLSIPILVLALHISSVGFEGALFRIVNADGWDNTSHLNLLQATSENDNYFYSTSPKLLNDTGLYNNYPQGWHLASTSILDSLIPNLLNPNTYGLSVTLSTYALIMFFWYATACYCLAKLAWGLLPKTKHRYTRSLVFFISLQVPVLSLLLTSLTSGFVNYLALMPMLLIVVFLSKQLIEDKDREYLWPYLVITSLFTAGVGLSWLMPVPALALLALLVFCIVLPSLRGVFGRSQIPALISIGVVLLAFLLYMSLFLKDIGFGQILVGNGLPEHFPGQLPVILGLVAIGIFYAIRPKWQNIQSMLLIMSPFVILVLGIWLFSYLRAGGLGYYNAKALGLLCVIIFTFSTVALTGITESLFDKLKPRLLVMTSVSISLVGLFIVLSGQTIDLRMFHKNQYILNSSEQAYITKWIYDSQSLQNNEQLLVERDDILAAPSSAMLFNRLTVDSAIHFLAAASPKSGYDFKGSQTCLLYIYYDRNMVTLPSEEDIYLSLSECLRVRAQDNLRTKILLPQTAEVRYKKLNTYGAELIYY